MKKIVLISLFVAVISYGMVNTEKLRMNIDQTGISGDIELSFDVTMGNTEYARLKLEPNMVGRFEKHLLFWLNDLSITWKNGDDFINKGYTHLRYNWDFAPKTSLEFLTQGEFNIARGLESRFLAGAGFRFLSLKRDHMLLACGLTGMFEYEETTDGEITQIPRGSTYLNFSAWKDDKISFSNTAYFQPSFEDFEDYRIMDEAKFAVTIFGNLSLTFTGTYFFDSQPPDGIKKYDFSLENGLEYSF